MSQDAEKKFVEVEPGQLLVTSSRPTILQVSHLGTSVALVMLGVQERYAGLAHVMLPDSQISQQGGFVSETLALQPAKPDMPARYADEAVPALLYAMNEKGVKNDAMRVLMAGGSQMFNFGGGIGNPMNVGARNAIAIRAALSKYGLVLEKTEIGGNKGRKIHVHVASGEVVIRQVGSLI